MSIYLYRLAKACFRHRIVVLIVWLLVAAGTIALAQASGGETDDNFTIPGTESQEAADVLADTLPEANYGSTQLVLATAGRVKVTDPAVAAAIKETLTELGKIDGVARTPDGAAVTDPYAAKTISRNQQVALATVTYDSAGVDVSDDTLDAVEKAVEPAQNAGVRVEYTGTVYPGWRMEISETPEMIGIAVGFVILLITFGAFVAAGLPILSAIFGVVVTMMGITAVASVVDIASASTTVATMLGLSCGIDYALFILSRHRNNLLTGMDPEESVGRSAGTAGSSVVFAALTVVIALCGLIVVGIPFLTAMGLAAAGAVIVSLLVSMTLLPALLGFAGYKVAKFLDSPLRPGHHEAVARTAVDTPERTAGAAWARFVVRYKLLLIPACIVGLLVLAIPALSMTLGLPSGAAKNEDDTQRQAYDLITDNFGEGVNGTLLVLAQGALTPEQGSQIAGRIKELPGVAMAAAVPAAQELTLIQVTPETGPNDTDTADLVERIRDDRDTLAADTDADLLVGGQTASNIDVSQKLADALPIFLIVVVGLAFVLLTFAFRTILVPIKSIIGFLLSIAAAFGVEVAVFQWGWGAELLGVTPTEIISFLPILMIAIIFGLSSDYEVFVVSRIKEEYTKYGDAVNAVERGTGFSARVVTAAALIMCAVFIAFVFTDDPTVRAIGFGFAVGVALDAFVVRLTLVPAVMAMVQAKLWYHPQWFARYVPDPDIEGEKLEERLAAH